MYSKVSLTPLLFIIQHSSFSVSSKSLKAVGLQFRLVDAGRGHRVGVKGSHTLTVRKTADCADDDACAGLNARADLRSLDAAQADLGVEFLQPPVDDAEDGV